MKLTVSQRVEQGTKSGVMKFRPGAEYAVAKNDDGYLVTHEPTERKQRFEEDGKVVRRDVMVSQTQVDAATFDKLSKVAKVEG